MDLNNLFAISDKLKTDNPTYIIGTGRMALLQFTTLAQSNIKVEGFISLDDTKPEYMIMGKDIYNMFELEKLEKCNLIIATENYETTKLKLEKKGFSDNVFIDIRMFSLINDCIWTFM